MMDFETFKRTIRNAEKSGVIRLSKEITDFDLAVQWAVARIGEERGYPCRTTISEINAYMPDGYRDDDIEKQERMADSL